MNITIIGTGYVGLVTGACFANLGHSVTCLDLNKNVIASLKKSNIPFYEPGLSKLVLKNITNKNLRFTTSYSTGCKNKLLFLCIDTPQDKDGTPMMKNFNNALRSIAHNIKNDTYLITKSTTPIGTTSSIDLFFKKKLKNKNISVDVCSNPEFLREGSAVSDFQNPQRIILGTHSEYLFKCMKKLYLPLIKDKNRILNMSPESAELTKYSSNAFLATKISFINEIHQIARVTGANIVDVRDGMALDSRIGDQFLNPGLGYGGSCFPKDLSALIKFQDKKKISSGVLKGTQKINNSLIATFSNRIIKFLGADAPSSVIILWGLSFKPNTDDLRESVSIKLIETLSTKVKKILAYDPASLIKAKNALAHIPNVSFIKQKYSQMHAADLLVIATEWDEFNDPDLSKLKLLKRQTVFDGRNMLDKVTLEDAGIEYFA